MEMKLRILEDGLRTTFCFIFIAGLLTAAPLGAACSCSISASVSQPADLTLTSTSSGACERLTGMVFLVDGGQVGNSAQFSVSTWTATIITSSACLKTAVHVATSQCSCGEIIPVDFCADTSGTASTSFSVNSTPTVSVSADGPNVLGHRIRFPGLGPLSWRRPA